MIKLTNIEAAFRPSLFSRVRILIGKVRVSFTFAISTVEVEINEQSFLVLAERMRVRSHLNNMEVALTDGMYSHMFWWLNLLAFLLLLLLRYLLF